MTYDIQNYLGLAVVASKYKGLVEAFMNKDVKVEAKPRRRNLVI